MNKLTDLEVCKKIAAIEGVKLTDSINDITGNYETTTSPYVFFNPLTDDALCFRLMVKYQVNVFTHNYGYYSNLNYQHSVTRDYYESPNHAICLAIIAANDG